MAEHKKNHFNLVNMAGIAIAAAAMLSIATLFLNSMPVVATLMMGAVAISTSIILAYDEKTEVVSPVGLTLVLAFVFSMVGAASGLIQILTQFFGTTPYLTPVGGDVSSKIGTNLIALTVGIGLFLLGQVFEE